MRSSVRDEFRDIDGAVLLPVVENALARDETATAVTDEDDLVDTVQLLRSLNDLA